MSKNEIGERGRELYYSLYEKSNQIEMYRHLCFDRLPIRLQSIETK